MRHNQIHKKRGIHCVTKLHTRIKMKIVRFHEERHYYYYKEITKRA